MTSFTNESFCTLAREQKLKKIIVNVSKNPKAYKKLEYEHRDNLDIALAAMTKDPLQYRCVACTSLAKNADILRLAFTHPANGTYMHSDMMPREYLLANVRYDPCRFKRLPQDLRSDPEVISAALEVNGNMLEFVPKHLITREMVIQAIQCKPNSKASKLDARRSKSNPIRFAPKAFKLDIDIARLAVRTNYMAIRYVKNYDRDMVLHAVKKEPSLIRYVPTSYREDKRIRKIYAVDKKSFKFLSRKYKHNVSFVLSAIRTNPSLYPRIDGRLAYLQGFMEACVVTNPNVLKHMSISKFQKHRHKQRLDYVCTVLLCMKRYFAASGIILEHSIISTIFMCAVEAPSHYYYSINEYDDY